MSTNENGIKLAPKPQWLEAVGAPAPLDRRRNQEPLVKWDQEANIQTAIDYLKTAPPSKQGSGGDLNAYQVACKVRGFGISEGLCVDLMLRFWYERCEPNNKPAFIARKAKSAYTYAQNAPGADTPGVLLKPYDESPQSPQQQKSRIFLPIKELVHKMKPREWLIDGVIATKILMAFFGASGSLKTFVTSDMLVCIAAGLAWAGRRVSQGPVFGIIGEGLQMYAQRIMACGINHGLTREEIEALPFHVSQGPVQIGVKGEVERVVAEVEEMAEAYGQPKMLLFDTLSSSFDGDENSTKDMTNFVNRASELVRTLGCTVGVVHHTGLTEKHRMRGSGVLYNACDTVLPIARENPKGLKVKVCSPVLPSGKMRDGEPFSDIHFEGKSIVVNPDDLSTSLALDHVLNPVLTKEERVLGVNQQVVMDCLKNGPLKRKQLKAGTGLNRQAFYEALKGLKDRGRIEEDEGVIRPVVNYSRKDMSGNVRVHDAPLQQAGMCNEVSGNVMKHDGHTRVDPSVSVSPPFKGTDITDATRPREGDSAKPMAQELAPEFLSLH